MNYILESYKFTVGGKKKPQKNGNLLSIASDKKPPKRLTSIFGAYSLGTEYVK